MARVDLQHDHDPLLVLDRSDELVPAVHTLKVGGDGRAIGGEALVDFVGRVVAVVEREPVAVVEQLAGDAR